MQSHRTTKANLTLAVVFALAGATTARAIELGYGGRVLDEQGTPLAGPVEMTVRFFGSASDGDQLGASLTFPAVELTDGVFQLTLRLTNSQQSEIFGDGSHAVYVGVEAGGKVYPRQSFQAVPMALRVPVDNDTVVFSPDSKLTLGRVSMSQVTGLAEALAPLSGGGVATSQQSGIVVKPFGTSAGETGELRFEEKTGGNYIGFKAPDAVAADKVWTLPAADGATGDVLITDGAGGLSWITLDGAAITSGTIGGTAAFEGSGGVQTSGAITGTGNFNVSGTGAATTELRFGDNDNSNYVGFKAPGTVAANKIWTLPATDGGAGQFLTTSGAGVLAWGSPAGGGDVMASANLSDLANVATARSNLGLGPLATASIISSSEIVDGTIANSDISTGAAIATSKLSGPLTSVTGHGLGSMATLSAVGSSEITDASIVNADVSGAAAIATSKLSGALTAVSGHGLGTLATLSAVGSSEITDGSVADTDISGTAQVATSKLSGAVTAIAGHGLGSLATSSAVGSAQITDGAIADADVSDTAAVATSKLSGAVTSISGHGLGSLATLSAVSSSLITDGTIVDADISGTAAISSSKVSFVNDGISGDKVDGGTISNFASTGIDDNASTTAVTIASSGNVGIGTTSPGSGLDVQAGTNTTGQIRLGASGQAGKINFARGDGSYSVSVGYPTSSEVNEFRFANSAGSGIYTFYTNPAGAGWAEAFRISNSGNVGIGTINPRSKLELALNDTSSVLGANLAQVGLLLRNQDTTTNNWNLVEFDSANGGVAASIGTQIKDHTNHYGDFAIATRGTGGWGERMRVTSSGNVGIGTTAPGVPLELAGSAPTFKISDSGGGGNTTLQMFSAHASVENWQIQTGAAGWQVRNATDAIVRLYVDGVGAMRSVRSGAGAGLTLESDAAANGGSGYVLFKNAGGNIGAVGPEYNNTDDTWLAALGARNLRFETNSSERMRIDSSGNVGIGTNAPGSKLQVSGLITNSMPSTMTPASNTQSIDWSTGNIQTVSLASATGDVTLTLTGATAGSALAVKVIQGATPRNLVWPASVKWPNASAPTITTTNGATDLITLFYDGTNYFGAAGQNYQ